MKPSWTAANEPRDWLLDDAVSQVLVPEHLGDEHRQAGRTAADFVGREVVPARLQLEHKEWSVARMLLRRCGELGLLGTDVPERAGGIGLDRAAAALVAEAMGTESSFAMAFGGQTGLTIVPLVCFGTADQQARYLPSLLAGALVGAYCLSEAGSGSDAFSARSTAVRQPDGSWILNGEKLWITTGGFADLFIVFAQADGAFSAFIVERAFAGVASGAEEHKMGLDGSSTTPVLFTDVRVPAGNLLGNVGDGRRIAYGVLNYGRFKLAATCCGSAKASIAEAATYAAKRRQFGQPLSHFGAIRQKLADMAIRVYAVESILYRTAGLVDGLLAGADDGPAIVAAQDSCALESSLLKIAGSEMLDFVTDELVQIHGGNGFVKDYPAERRYRDARINRIFEGTNEINRLLAVTLLRKRLTAKGVALASLAESDGRAAGQGAVALEDDNRASLPAAQECTAAITRLARLALAASARAFGGDFEGLKDNQEVTMLLADLLVDTFAADSATTRARIMRDTGHPMAREQQDAAGVLARDGLFRAASAARTVLCATQTGPTLQGSLSDLDRLQTVAPFDTIAARRRVADGVVAKGRYPFGG